MSASNKVNPMSTVEVRRYDCGCIDRHDSSLWHSTCMNHCSKHAWDDAGNLRPFDENPAEYEEIPYHVVPEEVCHVL